LDHGGGSLKQFGDALASDVALWRGARFRLDKVEVILK
jgi:hypothetical protein